MKKRILAFIIAIIMLATFTVGITSGFADAGNFSSDFDFDFGDFSSSFDDFDYGYDSDYDYGYDSSGDTFIPIFMGGFGDIVPIIIIAIIAFVIYVSVSRKKNKANKNRPQPRTNVFAIDTLKQKDPNFSEAAFLEKVNNYYVRMQNAWQEKNWEPMRAVFTDDLYNQFARQLDELIAKGYTNIMERICVMNSTIIGYSQEGDNDVLTVSLMARLTDYTVDSEGNVVSGDKNAEKYLTYEYKLIRDKDAKTLSEEALKSVACPNCGAPADIAKSAKCEYCGTIITVESDEWVISSIRGISQRTVR